MSDGVTVEFAVHFARGAAGRLEVVPGEAPAVPELPVGSVPRVARRVPGRTHSPSAPHSQRNRTISPPLATPTTTTTYALQRSAGLACRTGLLATVNR